jgi:hypothetical protein
VPTPWADHLLTGGVRTSADPDPRSTRTRHGLGELPDLVWRQPTTRLGLSPNRVDYDTDKAAGPVHHCIWSAIPVAFLRSSAKRPGRRQVPGSQTTRPSWGRSAPSSHVCPPGTGQLPLDAKRRSEGHHSTSAIVTAEEISRSHSAVRHTPFVKVTV